MVDIVIDIETLGTKPYSPVIEIGACAINPQTGAFVGNFSRRVNNGIAFDDLRKREFMGRASEDMRATVEWWFADKGREETLRKILSGRRVGNDAAAALLDFCEWMAAQTDGHHAEGVRVWANGPQFDLVILQGALEACGLPRPWICWQERCVRTALELAGYEKGATSWIERGPRHRALNDARHEARKLYHSGALGEVSAIMLRLRQRYDAKARMA